MAELESNPGRTRAGSGLSAGELVAGLDRLTAWFGQFQACVCGMLEEFETDGHSFRDRAWSYDRGKGGGVSRVLRGSVFEKAGVSTSCIEGTCSRDAASQIGLDAVDERVDFRVSGISVIVHPLSPFVPAVHFNTRCFTFGDRYWFGGVMDLNPMLQSRRSQSHPDSVFFHKQLMDVCCQHYDLSVYQRYKDECDRYFFLPHRNIPRGVGGVFYDHVANEWNQEVSFTRALGGCFLETYRTLVTRNKELSWSSEDRLEQLQQRSIYAEFNLLYDRGTRFGLKFGGNMDAIFSSMPPVVAW